MSKSHVLPDPAPPHEGRFRIAAVAELTGIPEPTLRAWERRYGIPTPERTASGYRLYGGEEIALLRSMRELCEGGMAAAEAARVLIARRSRPTGVTAPRESRDRDHFALAVDAMLDAVERFDDEELERQTRRLSFLGTATELLERVITPVLRTVGDRWEAGDLSVGQEHMASDKLGIAMRDLIRLLPGSNGGSPAVLACFEDDEHELGLLGVALRLSQMGMRPLFLGARTPPSAVRAAVKAVRPCLVALSVTIAPSRARARSLVDDYAAAVGDVPWVVGGAAADSVATLVGKAGGAAAASDAEVDSILRGLVQRGTGARRGKRPG